MRFENRADAGRKLAEALAAVIQPPCVVAAIPRGGLSIAMPIVERFHLPLTVVYARKLTARVAPEFAFGAIDEDGQTFVEASSVALLGLSPAEVERAKERVSKEIQRRMATYGVPALGHYLPDTAVVLVDDGLATGLTMRAAVEYARRHGAREIIVAVPCASEPAAREFERSADRFVSLVVDPDFRAVGMYYQDFAPVTDAEVIAMLRGTREPAARTSRTAIARDERITFNTTRGFALAGRLLLPAALGPHPVVVFAHGWGSGKDSPRNVAAAEALRDRGFAAFLFDFTGHGDVIFAIYYFKSELREGYSQAGRAAAPLKTMMLPVPPVYREILQKYFPYYQKLRESDKTKFERKVCNFLYGKRFIPRDIDEVTIEAKVLIAATAVQITFGLTDVYLRHFNKILVYPNEYYSVLFRRYHKGEVNPRFGVIVLSWQSFVDGMIYPNDAKNLGLHEMAHALRLENMLRSPDYPLFDEDLFEEFDEHAQSVCSQIENWSETFFRPYACANEHEFFSVSIEHFFERPEDLKNEMPRLYAILVKLLNQDPLLLHAPPSL